MLDASNLSVQLYTVRDALNEDFDGTLERLASFGYRQVEPFRFVDSFDALSAGLSKHGLTAPSSHISLVNAPDLSEVFGAAKELGIGTVIDPHTDPALWQSEDGIKSIATALNAAAAQAADHGLRVGYHNHAFELEAKVNGKHGLEVLVDNLAPEVVLEVDTYWAYAGGADVPALLQRLGDRVIALHIKDGDGSMDNKKQVAVGAGSLPVWDFVAANASLEIGVVELDDTTGDVFDAVRDSYTFLMAGDNR